MIAAFRTIAKECRTGFQMLCLSGFGLALIWQIAMLIALMVRFQALPNYQRFYNWPENVLHIIRSTPSWSDVPPIVAEEWLIEIGKMNYDYGIGISEWSLNVVPYRLVLLFLLGAMCALLYRLNRQRSCKSFTRNSAYTATGVGALLVGFTNVTLSWVVCCATPSWVVGLAMLGLGVSTSLALESLGPPIMLAGFGILTVSILLTAWSQSSSASDYATSGMKSHA